MLLWLASTGVITRELPEVIKAPKTKPLNKSICNVKKKKYSGRVHVKNEVIGLVVSLSHSPANQQASC